MIGRVFAFVERTTDSQGKVVDIIKDVNIAMWREAFIQQPVGAGIIAVLLEVQSHDHVALWEALESVVERDSRFTWIREYPGIKSLLDRRKRNEEPRSYLTF